MSVAAVKCASCASFPLADAVNATNSRALCPYFATMRRWDYPACPLYEYAKHDINQRKAWVKQIHAREKETMKNFDTKPGDLWVTAMKNRVRVVDMSISEVIQAEYVDGAAGRRISFDRTTGCSVADGDCLVERVPG